MRNDNVNFMGHECTIKYVTCWAMKPYTLISWAMKILRNQFPGLGYNHSPKYIKILYNIK